jgi:hypothetical protein
MEGKFMLPISNQRTMRREDIVSWLRRRRIILLYSINLFSQKQTEVEGDERQMNKYGFLKRRAIQFLADMNDRMDEAFKLPAKKYQVSAYVAETNTTEEDDRFKESYEVKMMRRDQVAKYVGDLRSILFEVRNAGHFKNPSYTREISTWQGETRDVKEYILDHFDENALVIYDYRMFATS